MNISVSLPNVFPNTLSPPTDSAKRDNMRREVIAQPKEVGSFAKEPEVGAEKDRGKPSLPVQYPSVQEQQFTKVTERDAQGREQQQQQEQQDSQQQSEQKSGGDQASSKQTNQNQFSESEQKALDELVARDREVRLHESQHQAVGGQYTSGANFELERGADGKQYAVGGEVSIDTSEVAGDPQATIAKMDQVQRAALAPAEPSAQDRQVAAQAQQKAAAAQAQLSQTQMPGLLASDEQESAFESAVNDVAAPSDYQQLQQQQAKDLQQRYPDIAAQMAQRNQQIQQRYASVSHFRQSAQLSLMA
ncbi:MULTISPECIES: putative metalloprotease CJM1_0395 family protein [unclassified Agarivorans]|uniref:putative metalloprotease CJM1_0395 family protein n=1 Tax=unclassified Agarivorans TaxID=2636026 RepID=UPI003D7DA99F